MDPLAMPSRNLPTTAAGDPKAKAQRNFTDPDSHILKGGDGWIQGYICQAAVDGDHQIIMAVGVSKQASDQHHFVPMLERIVVSTGQLPEKMIADAGYCSTSNIEASEQRGLDAYLSTTGRSTASGHGHHVGQRHGIWMHGAGWTADSDPSPARRSTPCVSSSPNRSLVKSKRHGGWIGSC
jgi:hypothetical protein